MLSRSYRALAVVIGLTAIPWSHAMPVLSAGSATVSAGDTFTIPISVSGAVDLQAFQFDLSYDSALLNALSFTDAGTDFEAAATAGGGALTGITGFSLPGLLSGVADSMSGATSGLTGNGVLVNVEFQALKSGISPLTLSNTFLNFFDQGFMTTNGEVCINSPTARCEAMNPAPEPGVLLLLAGTALAFVATRQSRWKTLWSFKVAAPPRTKRL